MRGELMRFDFITSFRAHTIRICTRQMITKCKYLLNKRGFYLDKERSMPLPEVIIDVLLRDKHIFTGQGTYQNGPDGETQGDDDQTQTIDEEN